MSALAKRVSKIYSDIDRKKDYYLDIDGFHTIIEFSDHSIFRGKHRKVYDSSILDMVRNGFYDIIDLHKNERFILICEEYGVSLIGGVRSVGGDIVITLITQIDSANPTNPYNTHTIYV